MDENINKVALGVYDDGNSGRYKIKKEFRNQDIKIGGVLYEKVIFNRDSKTLSNILNDNKNLISYLVVDEEINNKEAILSLNKEVDELLQQINKLEKENKEYNKRLKKNYYEVEKLTDEIKSLKKCCDKNNEEKSRKVIEVNNVSNDKGLE